jgi:hypothetical protein
VPSGPGPRACACVLDARLAARVHVAFLLAAMMAATSSADMPCRYNRNRVPVVDCHGGRCGDAGLCRAKTRTPALSWCFLRSLCCPPVLADQALDGLSALDPGGHIDRPT